MRKTSRTLQLTDELVSFLVSFLGPHLNTSGHAIFTPESESGGVRFAPSPTGRLHLGNLRTAWISRQWAHALQLPWVVRFEDIDEPRVLRGAVTEQLADLATLGLVPDRLHLQSASRLRHLELFQQAKREQVIYSCNCSRRDVQLSLAGLASAPNDGASPIYSGHCRDLSEVKEISETAGVAWRFRMPRLDGRHDFIIARTSTVDSEAGFVCAYHWACAIDDFEGAYELIVRSVDLAPALPLQRAIQAWLAKSQKAESPLIRAFHTALVVKEDGHRLEKRTPEVTLPELIASGWDPSKLLLALGASFDRALTTDDIFDDDGIGREVESPIRVREILNRRL